jgi:hypothetical protein
MLIDAIQGGQNEVYGGRRQKEYLSDSLSPLIDKTIPGALTTVDANFGTRHNSSKDVHQSSRVEEHFDLRTI